MSRGQLARTPENFPDMKHRAAGRHYRRKHAERMGNIFDAFARAMQESRKAFTSMGERVAAALHSISTMAAEQRQSQYALMPGKDEE